MRSEPVEKDECRWNDNPVKGHAPERQDGSYKDERDAGDGNWLTAARHVHIVAAQSARRVALGLGCAPREQRGVL